MGTNRSSFQSQFAKDVYEGLTEIPRSLPSKYLYDATGDALFQEIMAMPSYYLTNCEKNILLTHREEIARYSTIIEPFSLIELGAGDGTKTQLLLETLSQQRSQFDYIPVDISANSLEKLGKRLLSDLPGLDFRPRQGTYFEVLEKLHEQEDRSRFILVLGSNIGNLTKEKAIEFLQKLAASMGTTDLLFIGFDHKKDPHIILDAYDDQEGITARFNKNILVRINRELGGNFDPDAFRHWETYDPESGTAKSFLVSTCEQVVTIRNLNLRCTFRPWETIHTEISQKYDLRMITEMLDAASLEVVKIFTHSCDWYGNYLIKKK